MFNEIENDINVALEAFEPKFRGENLKIDSELIAISDEAFAHFKTLQDLKKSAVAIYKDRYVEMAKVLDTYATEHKTISMGKYLVKNSAGGGKYHASYSQFSIEEFYNNYFPLLHLEAQFFDDIPLINKIITLQKNISSLMFFRFEGLIVKKLEPLKNLFPEFNINDEKNEIAGYITRKLFMYDAEKEVKFASYIYQTIENQIKDLKKRYAEYTHKTQSFEAINDINDDESDFEYNELLSLLENELDDGTYKDLITLIENTSNEDVVQNATMSYQLERTILNNEEEIGIAFNDIIKWSETYEDEEIEELPEYQILEEYLTKKQKKEIFIFFRKQRRVHLMREKNSTSNISQQNKKVKEAVISCLKENGLYTSQIEDYEESSKACEKQEETVEITEEISKEDNTTKENEPTLLFNPVSTILNQIHEFDREFFGDNLNKSMMNNSKKKKKRDKNVNNSIPILPTSTLVRENRLSLKRSTGKNKFG